MTCLNLSPLPSSRSGEASSVSVIEKDGFVDDSVVLALVAGPSSYREMPSRAELALAADRMDFAGWCLTPDSSGRADAPAGTASSSQPIQRPTPPVYEEPGIGEPHRGQHRWWLACLAGAIMALMISVLLISLSSRYLKRPGENFIVETLAKPQAAAPSENPDSKQAAPELTEASP